MTKEKYQVEFVINASPTMLYNYIFTPSGLSEWFAHNVNSRGEKYIFDWDGNEEIAYLIRNKQDHYVRFRWEVDEGTKYFFEIAIEEDELTNDVAIIITDFAEAGEVEEGKLLWTNQIDDLKKIIGSK